MTNPIDTSFDEPQKRSGKSGVRRGLGLLALATVVAGMVFASSEALDVRSTAAAHLDAAPSPATPPGRANAPPPGAPTPEFDPATLRPQQPAVGMPEHG